MTAGPEDGLVVGLDLGDGETTLAWTTENGEADIRVFQRASTGERGVLTAMARAATDRRRLLGEEAVYAAGAAEFNLNFKQRPDPASLETPEAVLFIQALIAEFLAARAEESTARTTMVVGHPTGWPEEVVDAYARYLRHPRIRTRLLPESQAALVHVRRHPGEQPPNHRVLVVDIGSSTTDFTVITDRSPRSLALGADFGCRRIDFQVADLVTERFKDHEVLRAAVDEDGGRQFLLLACRRAKEAQFSGTQAEILNLPVNPRFRPIVDLAWAWLRFVEIPTLVAAPGGWVDEFRALLTEALRLMDDTGPDQVVLTGGGSRMPFTRRICQDVFPDAVIENDPEPAFSVARGLALAGHTELRLERFRAALAALLDEPDLAELCREHIVQGFAEIRQDLLRRVRKAASMTGRAYPEIEEHALEAGDPPAIGKLRGALNQRLGDRVGEMCRAYDVPDAALDLDFQLPLSVAETFAGRLREFVASQERLKQDQKQWLRWFLDRQADQHLRKLNEAYRNPRHPTRTRHPAWQAARLTWYYGVPVVTTALGLLAMREMVKDIEALSLGEEQVSDLQEKIRAHIREQLLGRLKEIEKLIF